MKSIIEVEIKNIEVDERYYSFEFRVTKDGVIVNEGEYESDHVWGDDQESFKELLSNSEAVKIALEQAF